MILRMLLAFFLLMPCAGFGQRVSGVIRDHAGQPLPLASIFVLPDSAQYSSNSDGSFSFAATPGKKEIIITYTGFLKTTLNFRLNTDTMFVTTLVQRVDQLKEVVVESSRFLSGEVLLSTRSGVNHLTQKDLNMIPALMGEADLIKTLQLLPGTLRGVEGSSDLFVRGGAADQNLVLLDGAPVYNTSHLFGFLSVFNPDVLDNVAAMNGGFPAEFGGRLSSILDIKTIDEIADRTQVSADIGLISSRIFLEQPLKKDKVGIWIAGRRTYIDQVVKAVGEELPYFFYDFNAKLILKPTARDNVQLSYYRGNDILDIFSDANDDGSGFLTTYRSGNISQSLRWNHTLTNKWETQMTGLRTKYDYRISNRFEENSLAAFSDIEDYGARFLIRNDSLTNGSVAIGWEWTRHNISPGIINSVGTIAELLKSSASTGRVANEMALFIQREISLTDLVRVNAGLRGSAGIVQNKNYFFAEPRVSVRYTLDENQALKINYSRMAQYMHRISNSAVSTPADIWYTITDSIRPQTSHQVSLAWQRTQQQKRLYFSVETYYKAMQDLIGYEEGTNLFFNNDFSSKLVQGRGRAYGVEALIKKDAGRLSGWLSYTLSWSQRQFDELNRGEWFSARYDRRHNGAVVLQYSLGKRWAISGVWEFISGSRFTPIIGQYTVLAPTLTGFDLIPVYAKVNGVKLSDSHRLDLGVKFFSKPYRKFQWHWFAGVYNVYNRASPIGIIIEQDENDGSLKYLQPGLFGFLPFISYGFKF